MTGPINPQRARVIELGLRGIRPQRIADLCGVSRNYVYRVRKEEREKGIAMPLSPRGPLPGAPQPPRHRPDRSALELLKAPAAARGLTPNELAREIIAVVARQGLVDAILDDGDFDA